MTYNIRRGWHEAKLLADMSKKEFVAELDRYVKLGPPNSHFLAVDLLKAASKRISTDPAAENLRTVERLQAANRHEREHAGKLEGKLRDIQHILKGMPPPAKEGSAGLDPAMVRMVERLCETINVLVSKLDHHSPTGPDRQGSLSLELATEAMSMVGRTFRGATPARTPDPEGWVDWQGGECPLHPDTHVDIKLAGSGDRVHEGRPRSLDWGKNFGGGDIVAYRLHREPRS